MSKPSPTFLLVSLPTSITNTNDKEDALDEIRGNIADNGTLYPFAIPTFKIGTLDALVQQADDLAKLDAACEGVVQKVADSLKSILEEGDAASLAEQKTINDKPVDQYLRSFSWNKVKYRADKSIAELIDSLQKEVAGIDNDVKSKFSQYNQVKSSLSASQRRQTGNLSTRSLASIVPPSAIVQDSEYIETHLIAVPKQMVKDFLKSYESLAPMVVPRSSVEVAADDEFKLFAVTTFKKHSTEFLHKCREHRWTPRDYTYKEGGREEEAREVGRLAKEERKLWGEALRLSRTGYSESAMIWVHVLALRVFVETVLRYGLPLEFVCALVQSAPKLAKKAKASLDEQYSYLAGNAFRRDKKGRVQKDDPSEPGATGGDAEYTAYVYYEFEFA